MLEKVKLPIGEITTEILRDYLADYKNNSKAGMVTIDNIRRTLSSFFAWLENEDYIVKSPVRRIHKVKTTKRVKETLTDENLEKLRDTCSNVRDLAILELLISTGMRVGELTRLNISDMDFQERSCIVLGKGNTEREVYFSAKSKMYIEKYLEIRTDDNEALFVSLIKPYAGSNSPLSFICVLIISSARPTPKPFVSITITPQVYEVVSFPLYPLGLESSGI